MNVHISPSMKTLPRTTGITIKFVSLGARVHKIRSRSHCPGEQQPQRHRQQDGHCKQNKPVLLIKTLHSEIRNRLRHPLQRTQKHDKGRHPIDRVRRMIVWRCFVRRIQPPELKAECRACRKLSKNTLRHKFPELFLLDSRCAGNTALQQILLKPCQ